MNHPPEKDAEVAEQLALVAKWLKWFTVAIYAMTLAMIGLAASALGTIIEFHAREGIMIAGACFGGAGLGFVLGWLARRAIC